MHITFIKIKNFRGLDLCIDNLQTKFLIVGRNDTGKSNLCFAIRKVLDPAIRRIPFNENDSTNHNKENIEIDQAYLYELEDRTLIDHQLKKGYLIDMLYNSLETLTDKQKRRLISYYFNNESIEEIALKEQVSESAIRKSIHQSLIQLKRKLNKYK